MDRLASSRSKSVFASTTSASNTYTTHQRKKPHQDIARTIKELTSNKKRLSDANLSTNDTIDFFTKIKNKRLKTSSLTQNPNFKKYNTYNPHDRKKLLERINTYNVSNWSIEDSELTPLLCARYGWICAEDNSGIQNQLRCHTCSATIVIKLNDVSTDVDSDEEFEVQVNTELIKRYISKLSSDHNESCPWKEHPSPLSAYLIQAYDYEEILDHLKKVFVQLNDNKQFLEGINYTNVIADEQLNKLQHWTNFEFDNDILMIGLLGWEFEVQSFGDNHSFILQCRCCNRKILIGMVENGESVDPKGIFSLFTPTSSPPPWSSSSPVSTEDDENVINVLEEHKNWCAFKTGYPTVLQFI